MGTVKFTQYQRSIRVDLLPIELDDFNGDKEAYVLSQFQAELGKQFILQYGRDRKTFVIYSKDEPAPLWQCKLPASFKRYIRDYTKETYSIEIKIPKTYINTREEEFILVRIKKTVPIATPSDFLGPNLIRLNDENKRGKRHLGIWSFENNRYEIYEIDRWEKAGLKYRKNL